MSVASVTGTAPGSVSLTVRHRTPGRVRLGCGGLSNAEAESLAALLGAHPHVRAARYSPALRSLTIEHDPAHDVVTIVSTLPRDVAGAIAPRPASAQPVWRQLLVPAISAAAAVTGSTPIASLVIAGCALPIARRAFRSVAGRRVNIDVLDATAVSLLLGVGDPLAAGVSVALIETGERIRKRASGRARHILRGWMGADAHEVRVLRGDSEPRVPISEVTRGDRAVVYAGETVPVDGVVISGNGTIDNRTWTGEPYPAAVARGSKILAGSTVNDGRLVLDVVALGEDTRAARLAAALEDAIAADTRVSDMAKRLADRFVIPLLLLGGGTLMATGDLSRLISILIVDFGTGIRVAVPTSILATMIAGAKQDILFRNGSAIEQLATVDTVIFDKTGTLTSGRPAIGRVLISDGWTKDAVLRLAAAAEGHIPHPVAGAVRRYARRHGLSLPQPEQLSYIRGGGVSALIEGHRVLVGNPRMLQLNAVEIPAADLGDSSMAIVAIDGVIAARIELRDHIKSGAPEMIRQLRGLGVTSITLATGDRPSAARLVARDLGLDAFRARMLPEDKSALVRELQAQGRRVALVGDGINDAAAMAEANVGIAVASGAELARETADVVLGSEDLMTLITAMALSQRAMALVRQNIGLVAIPNGAALTAAVLGGLPPLAATAANNGSTLLAALNALRPLRWEAAPPSR